MCSATAHFFIFSRPIKLMLGDCVTHCPLPGAIHIWFLILDYSVLFLLLFIEAFISCIGLSEWSAFFSVHLFGHRCANLYHTIWIEWVVLFNVLWKCTIHKNRYDLTLFLCITHSHTVIAQYPFRHIGLLCIMSHKRNEKHGKLLHQSQRRSTIRTIFSHW